MMSTRLRLFSQHWGKRDYEMQMKAKMALDLCVLKTTSPTCGEEHAASARNPGLHVFAVCGSGLQVVAVLEYQAPNLSGMLCKE